MNREGRKIYEGKMFAFVASQLPADDDTLRLARTVTVRYGDRTDLRVDLSALALARQELGITGTRGPTESERFPLAVAQARWAKKLWADFGVPLRGRRNVPKK